MAGDRSSRPTSRPAVLRGFSDFPTVCLSQAVCDEPRRRAADVNPESCTIIVDGGESDAWREVDGDLETLTAVGERAFLLGWL